MSKKSEGEHVFYVIAFILVVLFFTMVIVPFFLDIGKGAVEAGRLIGVGVQYFVAGVGSFLLVLIAIPIIAIVLYYMAAFSYGVCKAVKQRAGYNDSDSIVLLNGKSKLEKAVVKERISDEQEK